MTPSVVSLTQMDDLLRPDYFFSTTASDNKKHLF